MSLETELDHFVDAQSKYYFQALCEIASGKKIGHWIWFIFPQLIGLGSSENSKKYSIQSIEMARRYLDHSILGFRIKELAEILLLRKEVDPVVIFGQGDAKKLMSSMTLFAIADGSEKSVFSYVLDKYFEGQMDQMTLDLLNKY